MAITTHSRAGIHLDGSRASVAIVHGHTPPAVELVQHLDADTGLAALAAAAALVPTDLPLRVTTTGPGFDYVTVETTATEVTRRGYTAAVHTALSRRGHRTSTGANTGTGTVAGTLGDLDAVAGGQATFGLACSAPRDLIDDLYATLAERTGPVEVVATAHATTGAALRLPEGAHLFLRRHSCELVWITAGRARSAHVLEVGGSDVVVTTLGGDANRAMLALAGAPADPLAAAAARRWLTDLAAEVASLLDHDLVAGGVASSTVYCHGPAASARDLPARLREHGLLHATTTAPARTLDPAEDMDAYAAAATCTEQLPFVAFLDSARLTRARARNHAGHARARRRHLVACAVAALVGMAGPPAAAALLAAHATHTADRARDTALSTRAGARDLTTAQLSAAGAAARLNTAVVAATTSGATADGLTLITLKVTTSPGTPGDAATTAGTAAGTGVLRLRATGEAGSLETYVADLTETLASLPAEVSITSWAGTDGAVRLTVTWSAQTQLPAVHR